MKNLTKLSAILLASIISFSSFAGNDQPETVSPVTEVFEGDYSLFLTSFDITSMSNSSLERIKAKFAALSSDDQECLQAAWDFGTYVSETMTFINAEQQAYWTWSATNWYYEKHCLGN